MLETIAFTYGMLASFVLTGASRNRRLARPNPPILQYLGYATCGSLAAFAMLLLVCAAAGFDPLGL